MKQLLGVFLVLSIFVSSLRATEVGPLDSVGNAEGVSLENALVSVTADSLHSTFSRSIWEILPDTELSHPYEIILDGLQFTWPTPGFAKNPVLGTAETWKNNLPHLSAAAFPQFNLANVPEPTTYALVGIGMLALVIYLRRQ